MKSKLNKRRGFTIVEIIVAVTIMATLMAIIVRSLRRARESAERSTYQARVREDAIIYAEEARRLQYESIGSTTVIESELNGYNVQDPEGGLYKFKFDGSQLTLSPGATLKKKNVHDETININDTKVKKAKKAKKP